jgi:hypothetical protein
MALSQKIQFDSNTSVQPTWNLEEMVDQVWRSLHEAVDPLMILQTLVEVLAEFEDARIQIFVPILACRRTQEVLKNKPAIVRKQDGTALSNKVNK